MTDGADATNVSHIYGTNRDAASFLDAEVDLVILMRQQMLDH